MATLAQANMPTTWYVNSILMIVLSKLRLGMPRITVTSIASPASAIATTHVTFTYVVARLICNNSAQLQQ